MLLFYRSAALPERRFFQRNVSVFQMPPKKRETVRMRTVSFLAAGGHPVIQLSRNAIWALVWNQCSPPSITVSSAPVRSAKARIVSGD